MDSAVKELPALQLIISGGIESSNLPDFRASALELINSINTDLVTDDDFSEAEKASKWLRDGEKRIEECKQSAIKNTATIDEAFSIMDELKESMRQRRLDIDRQVKAEKELRRNQIQQDAARAFSDWKHEATLNIPVPIADDLDISSAMKGKKAFSSLQTAANNEVERAKEECQWRIDVVMTKVNMLNSLSKGYEGLFMSDRPALLSMEPDCLVDAVRQRIDAFNDEQERQHEETMARIRKEEEDAARARYEAQKAEEERERLRLQREAESKAADEEHQRMEQLEDLRPSDDYLPPKETVEPEDDGSHAATRSCPDIAPSDSGFAEESSCTASNGATGEMVSIPQQEYEDLLRSKRILECLQSGGIADWAGLDNAMEAYRKLYEH